MNLFHNRSSYLRPTKLSVHGSGNNVNNFAIQKTNFFFLNKDLSFHAFWET